MTHDVFSKPDNGYERDGNGGYRKINDNGGDETDYLYENGQIVDSTPVIKEGDFSGTDVFARGYGIKTASSIPKGGHA